MAETLAGTIEQVVYHNPENGFSVLRVQPAGRRDPVIVVGHLAVVAAGEYVDATGHWANDRNHGLQFKADELRTTPPGTAAGIEKYLASGLIKGIGPHFAKRIVETFGERTLAVIDESPGFLKEVRGIGKKRIEEIRKSWQEQKGISRIMVFLQSNGIGTARAVRIYKTYGDQAVEKIKENPYRLATDIWGIGFKIADELALKLGLERNSPLRARAAISFVLQELSYAGHVGFPEAGVIERTAQLTEIDHDIIVQAIGHQIQEKELVRDPLSPTGEDEPGLYLKRLHQAETGTAKALRALALGPHPLQGVQVEAALQWVEKEIGLELAPAQRDAIRQAITRKVLVITGGPGVGKTTIVNGILRIFAAKGMDVTLCAPTGRAAKRLQETTGCEAKTIHRLLEFDPQVGQFARDEHRPIEAELVVCDEASMLDISLAHHLLRAVAAQACLVLVGDVDQLPSVGPGTVLGDIIRSRAVPVVRLTEIFRQAEASWIVRAAHRVNQGELPASAPPPGEGGKPAGDFFVIDAEEPEVVIDRIITLVRDRIPSRFGFDPLKDVQILTPMNKSDLGARNLNARLQEVFNPPQGKAEVQRFGWTFRPGDKVLQTVNNYQKEVFNGDIGRVTSVDAEDQEVKVNFDGRDVAYELNELDELALAYALTIHKSQGSEYPAVVIPLHMQHFMLLQRNLVYTGITRGKKLVVVVGSKKALGTAVRRQETAYRYSALARRLRESD